MVTSKLYFSSMFIVVSLYDHLFMLINRTLQYFKSSAANFMIQETM